MTTSNWYGTANSPEWREPVARSFRQQLHDEAHSTLQRWLYALEARIVLHPAVRRELGSIRAMIVDAQKAQVAKSDRRLLIRENKLVTRWIPRISVPGFKPIWISSNGVIVECTSQQEADAYAATTVAEWRALPADEPTPIA